ncbi:hypothetical protein BB560_002286 [Smittium megazygosporum]|uniref:YCII-related domain-containing protein n=1 Tax=Smittium megazygosporum TaxID=133381 RepID=A0A2T9ZF86_9FUNG|nr:hypothetical protein BB560_002286 [Smittium megazygosporum]
MSSDTSNLKTFFIKVYDFTDEEALSRRMAVRQQHIEGMKPVYGSGVLVTGGAILDDNGKMIGSALILKAESKEAAIELMSNDVYATGRAWDMSTVDIVNYKPAF